MAHTDPVSDMLTRIRNANMRKHKKVIVPHSKFKEGIVRVLKEEGFIIDYKIMPDEELGDKKKTLHIYLKYGPDGQRVITKIVRVSKPSRRIFRKVKELERVLDGLGISILSTSQGIISDNMARKLNIGGEVICKVW